MKSSSTPPLLLPNEDNKTASNLDNPDSGGGGVGVEVAKPRKKSVKKGANAVNKLASNDDKAKTTKKSHKLLDEIQEV